VEVIETPHNSGLTREIKATNCFLLPHNFRSATGSIKLEKINQTLHNSYDSPGQKSASSLVNGHAVPNSWGVGESTLATRIGSPISNMFNQQQRTETERIRRELTAKGFTENGPRGKTFSVYTRQEEALPTDEELRTIIRENFPTLNATLPAYRLRARLACILNTKVTRVRNYHLEARDNTGKIIGEINLPAGDIWFLQKNSWTQNKITPEANRAISLAEKIQKGLEAEQKLAKNPLTLADIMSMS
jgi:hypothetical protein